MKPKNPQSPVELYFMDARSKLIDIAAFMDRVQRDGGSDDFRYHAFLEALAAVQSAPAGRAETVLRTLSDPTTELIPAATTKAACGAPPKKS